jgi:hypothetical protein
LKPKTEAKRILFGPSLSGPCSPRGGPGRPLEKQQQTAKKGESMKETIKLQVEELEERIAPSNANFPPGQFPSGNPAHAPGNSNPNEVPANNPSNDK